jgi:hypothetical protein
MAHFVIAAIISGNLPLFPLGFRGGGPRSSPRGPSNVLSNLAHLAGQPFLDLFPPDDPAGTRWVRAALQSGQLLAPFPDQGVEPEQLRLEFQGLAFFASHYGQCDLSP